MSTLRHDSGKPLPASPVHKPTRHTLTVDSITHLHQFIDHVLEEETGYCDADKDAWVSSIEAALHHLAKEVDAGFWLAGLRSARVAKLKREEQAAAEDRKREQERLAKEKETEARNKAKHRAPAAADLAKHAKELDPPATEPKVEAPRTRTGKPPSDDANRNLRALQQLRNLAYRCRDRTSSSDNPKRARHLLLTVTLPDHDASLSLPSSSVTSSDATGQRCAFSPGIYSLPPPDLFGEDPDDNNEAVVNSALYGFNEWDGASVTHTQLRRRLTPESKLFCDR
jgi:1-phosphatidylinositol-3-phosphate 5-kinase